MSRGLDREARETLPKAPVVRTPDQREGPQDRTPSREREATSIRGRVHRVSPAELETLRDVGRFRTIAVTDLASHRYAGNGAQLQQDLRALGAQGLTQQRTVWLGGRRGKLSVVMLTRAGKDVVQRNSPAASQQAVYAGFVKPAEVAHDAAIYRMYHAEAALIKKEGGRVRRVILDYELKKRIYSPLAKAKDLPALEYAKRKAEITQENGLKLVDGKILLPDLRIEYVTADGELARVDLELATHHYHGSQLRAKAEAGFKMYAADSSVTQRSAVREDRELTAAILSL